MRVLVFLADRADVADRVHGARAERVVARQARPDFDARKLVAARGEARQLFIGQLQPDRHGFEAAPGADEALQAGDVVGVEQAERRQRLERGVDVAEPARA